MNPTHTSTRRALLLALATVPLARWAQAAPASPLQQLAALEAESGGRLGVAAVNLADGKELLHRAGERFPMCSTFKTLVAATALARSVNEDGLMGRRIHYTKADLVPYAPVTETHLDDGMTVEQLCDAMIRLSDNAAANLLMKVLGGPEQVTAYARSIGDTAFRLDRWETELNSAIPGDERDTTTPQAMTRTLRALALGDALPAPQRAQLVAWMLACATGDNRIRAGVPAGWTVADKTGAGAYGTVNDIAVLWPPGQKAPIVLSLFLTQPAPERKQRNDVLASAARIVVGAFH